MTDRPVLLMVAGPNGAGKTTLTGQLKADGVDLGQYINPDDIAATLIGSYDGRVREAQRMADALREECLSHKRDFTFETVMSHLSKVQFLQRARVLGYSNVLYFVGTESPELNVARVRQRVALGGHDVPKDRIAKRYYRTMSLLPEAIAQCDRVVLFDNSYRDSADGRVRLAPFCELVRQRERTARGSAVFLIGRLDKDHTPNWAWTHVFRHISEIT